MLASGSKDTTSSFKRAFSALIGGYIHTAIHGTTETVDGPRDQDSGKDSNAKYAIRIPCLRGRRLDDSVQRCP